MGNLFAYFMLAIWPVVAMVITKKKSPDTAVVLLFLVPYLILPPIIALSISSSLDKYIIPSLAALFIMATRFGSMTFLPNSFPVRVMMLLLALGPLLTFFYNRDPVFLAQRVLPSMTIRDAIAMEISNFCWVYVPFCMGFTWLRTAESHVKVLAIIAVAGLIYTIPMLWEIRMSPQLNATLYGFFPSDFDQQIRAGGFRPVVFLQHGLRVAAFFSMSIMAAIVIHKIVKNNRDEAKNSRQTVKSSSLKIAYMLVVMFLCKTWSALIYTVLAMMLFFYTKPRVWAKFSVIVVTLVFIFPFVRSSNLLPLNQLSDFFSQYNSERGGSLQYRFDNEDILLERANLRPLAGWGGWGRSHVYDEMGKDISVTDGSWIIVFGVSGWLGYIAQFGLIFFPVLMVYRGLDGELAAKTRHSSGRVDAAGRGSQQTILSVMIFTVTLVMRIFSSKPTVQEIPLATAGILVVLAFNMIDLIPNSSAMPFNYLLAGALMGYAKSQAHAARVVKNSARYQSHYRLS